ncbi:MAG: NAD(P)/FAD-dependent oxidoreductase [Kouleothrix sp.]|jgi:sulfide:quinone oxidoreductase|nr:NAD(P)/FAD-dependent oxidoreductase [Kouleothrix sp.]
MARKRIVIVGTSFAGYTGALELHELLGDAHDITVVANTHEFVFIPSLIWYPFGLRDKKDIAFDVRPIYAERQIKFVEAAVTGFDLEQRLVKTGDSAIPYDYLLIATGPKVDFESVPGLGPHKNSWSICNVAHAEETRQAWERFLHDPGPIVIGASQGAACFGAAYEFIFNMRYQLKKHHLLDRAPLTFVTAEPFLGHFGIGGFGNAKAMSETFFNMQHINWRTNSVVKEVLPDSVLLGNGEVLPSKFTMIIPRFLGIDAIRNTPGLGNANGFIETDDGYRHKQYPEVYAAGVAVFVPPADETEVPCGVPKTGYPSEVMAKTAAANIAADINGGERKTMPFSLIHAYCIMDTGNMGMLILGDHMVGARHLEFIIPGPQAHWAKLAFEKYFLYTRKHGHV